MPTDPPIERVSTPIGLGHAAATAPARLFFGGSFDPPHLAHAQLPARIAAMLGNTTQVIYVPAGRSPFKSAHPLADHHRIAMLELALQNQCGWEIWEQELRDAPMNPNQPSYWADTWAIIDRLNMPGLNRFLIGADQALSMHRWHRYTEFWQDALVMLRANSDSAELLIDELTKLNIWSAQDIAHWRRCIGVVPMIDVSSSAIRAALRDPARRANPIDGLAPQVQAYILEHDLYQ